MQGRALGSKIGWQNLRGAQMKRILLLTVSVLAACLFGAASGRDLDGRYADSPLREWFISQVAMVFAVRRLTAKS
jgi:hypothetical protein